MKTPAERNRVRCPACNGQVWQLRDGLVQSCRACKARGWVGRGRARRIVREMASQPGANGTVT